MSLSLGEVIKRERLDKGYTQTDVARLLGINRVTIYRYETHIEHVIPVNLLINLVKLYELDLHDTVLLAYGVDLSDNSTMGKKLRNARIKMGMSQKDVARALDINSTTICRYEMRNNINVKNYVMRKLMGLYNIRI